MRSGWCSAPTGARPQHEWCRSAVCRCECHGAETPAVERDSASQQPQIEPDFRYAKGTTKDGPDAELVPPAGPTDRTLRRVIG